MSTKSEKKKTIKLTLAQQQKVKMQTEKWDWCTYIDKNGKKKFGRIVEYNDRTASLLNPKDPLVGDVVKVFYGKILPEEPELIP